MNAIDQIGKRLSDLKKNHAELLWTMYTNGFDFGIAKANDEIQNFYKDKTTFVQIEKALESSDPVLSRKAEILHSSFKPFHQSERANVISKKIQELQNKISQQVNATRLIYQDRQASRLQLSQLLREEACREKRKQIFLCQAQFTAPTIEAGFVELINYRKELALECGFDNFVSMQLNKQGLKEDLFDNWLPIFKQKSAKTNSIISDVYSQRIGVSDPMPWDHFRYAAVANPSDYSEVNIFDYHRPVSQLFEKFGFDFKSKNITFDLFPRANKSEWAYCFTIEVGRDTRILGNFKNHFHHFWVLLHESAHAYHFQSLPIEEYALNHGVSGIVAEGLANLFGDLAYSREFLGQFFPDRLEQVHRDYQIKSQLTRIRNLNHICSAHFDRSLYLNEVSSQQDIDQLYWEAHVGSAFAEPYAEQPVWASTPHFTTHPIYLHNYLMGDIMCEELAATFCRDNGIKSIEEQSLKFGEFLDEKLIQPSGRYKFDDHFKILTGHEFSLERYVDGITN